MAHIGDVAHKTHFVAALAQPAVDHVEADKGPAVADMHVAVDGRPADIHADAARGDGFENLFFPTEGVENPEFIFHGRKSSR